MKIETRDPRNLTVHPARKALPQLPGWEKDGEHFISLVEDVRYRELDKPLIVDEEDQIIDGEGRWRVAKQLQLTEVPVIVRKGDAASILVASQATKKRLPGASALAFYCYPVIASAFQESGDHRLAYLKRGPVSANLHLRGKPRNIEHFADELGVGRRYLFDAKKVWQLFDAHPGRVNITDENGDLHEDTTFREYYGRRLLLGEVRLGAVIAGIAGHIKSRGKDRPETKYFRLFTGALKRWNYFDKLAPQERRKAADEIKTVLAGASDEMVTVLRAGLREREKGGGK
jgi:hypothetical protein